MHALRFLLALALGVGLLAGCGASSPPKACADGQAGCACHVDDTCDDGLSCDLSARTCEGTHAAALPAIDPAARSCELLLEDDGARVVRADFADSVRGEWVRQDPRTAVTFYATRDARVAPDAVQLQLAGPGGMTLLRARCFDREGHALPGGGLASVAP